MGGDVDNEIDCGEPREDEEATEGEGGTIGGWKGMDIDWTGDVACEAGSSMSQSAKMLLSKTVACLHCSSRSKRKLSESAGCLCVENMAGKQTWGRRRGAREGVRKRGNGERTEATRRGFI